MRIDARGLTFDVRVDGPARASGVAVLLHGFPQHGGQWDAVVPSLHAAGLRTVVPDQRGYSPGARPDEVSQYRLTETAADVLALLDALAIGQPVHLVGHDWGAVVGWRLAATAPARLASWTAVSTPHPAAFVRALATDADQLRRSAYVALFRRPGRAEQTLLADGAQRLRAMFAGSELDGAGVDRYVAPLLEPGALTAALKWYRAISLRQLLVPKVRVPTAYVWSDADVAIGPTAAHLSGRYVIGDYRITTLPGVSHWISDQAPDLLADVIVRRALQPA